MFSHTILSFPRRARTSSVSDIYALGLHRLIINTGVGLFGLFLPIFLYELFGRRVWAVLVWTLLYYLITTFGLPLGARYMSRVGLRRTMAYGIVGYAIFLGAMALDGHVPWWASGGGSLLALICSHVLYWVPYHVEFTERAPLRKFGEAVAWIAAGTSVIGIVVPVFSGWMIERTGYTPLLMIALSVVLLSLLPILRLKPVAETYAYGYRETFRILFSRGERVFTLAYAAEGAESVVGTFVWPLFLYLLLDGKPLDVGALSTAVVAVSVVLQVFVGGLTDKRDKASLLKIGTGLSSVGWILKSLVATAGQVFVAGAFHSFAMILMQTPYQALMYSRAADAGHYVDEYTVLREMALNVGRAAMLVLLILVTFSLGLPSAFVLAAFATLGLNLMTKFPTTVPPNAK